MFFFFFSYSEQVERTSFSISIKNSNFNILILVPICFPSRVSLEPEAVFCNVSWESVLLQSARFISHKDCVHLSNHHQHVCFFFSVGFNGQNNLVTCGPDLEGAKRVFTKK